MITKKQFIKYLNYIKKTEEKEDKVDKFIQEISIDGCCFMFSDEISHMIEMLCSLMDIKYNADDLIGDDLQWFIYDLDYGKAWKPDCFTDANGNSIDVSTPEKFYDYVVDENRKKSQYKNKQV